MLAGLKTVSLMNDLVANSSNGGHLVVDSCAEMASFVKACVMLAKPRRFVGYAADAMCCNASLASVLKRFVWQVLNEYLDIKVRAQVTATVRTFVSAVEEIQQRRKR